MDLKKQKENELALCRDRREVINSEVLKSLIPGLSIDTAPIDYQLKGCKPTFGLWKYVFCLLFFCFFAELYSPLNFEVTAFLFLTDGTATRIEFCRYIVCSF